PADPAAAGPGRHDHRRACRPVGADAAGGQIAPAPGPRARPRVPPRRPHTSLTTPDYTGAPAVRSPAHQLEKTAMSKPNQKPVALAMCTALAGGIVLAGSAFAMEPLSQGYLLAAQDAKATDAKAAEGKCGEGKCGIERVDTDKDGKVSRAEFDTAHPDKGD